MALLKAFVLGVSSFQELQGAVAWPRPEAFRRAGPSARKKFVRREAVLVDASGHLEQQETRCVFLAFGKGFTRVLL